MEQKLFSVLPMSQRFSLEAGQTYEGSIMISNSVNATEDFAYRVSVTPYSIIGDSYAADFSTVNAYTTITDWITIDNPTGLLHPNEHHSIHFTITVPDDAPAGGQYAALVVGEDPNAETLTAEGVNVSNVLQLASVIYADVTGIIKRDGEILDNYLPGFSLDNHVTASAIVQNRGNVHSDAIIAINVDNLLTGESIFPIEEDDDKFREIVMPESTRYITRTIDNLPPLGIIKLRQTVYFNDIVSTKEQTLIICPLWFIFLVTFAIVSVITLLIARHHHRRKTKHTS